jgi:DNA-binding CsgD family transcriptional regulator
MATMANSGVFVGREAELDLVSSALDAARGSAPQIVAIEGEAGIGKTALLHRLVGATQDVVVLEASGDESEIALDYGVLQQLASRAAQATGDQSLGDAPDGWRSTSAFSAGARLLEILGALQDEAPVVLALDDAHWMDASSAGALLFALRRLYADRVLVLIAARPEGLERLGPSWQRFLGDPERVQRVRLGGLKTHEVGQLSSSLGAGQLTIAAAERLREHTDGHPLYVKVLISELPANVLAFDSGPLPAPHSFAATVISRLSNVSVPARDLVAAAAVAGERCPLALTATLAGVSDPLVSLEDAMAAGLLELVPARIPEEVAFPHPLVRAAVYDDLSPSRRRQLHLECAKLTPASDSLPHRVAASAGEDDALAGELAAAGEEQADSGHLVAAAEQLLWASRIAASSEPRERTLLRATECLVLAGELARALTLRDAVLACGDSPRKSLAIGCLTMAMGRPEEATAVIQELVDRPDFTDNDEMFGSVGASLAIGSALTGRRDQAVVWARRVLDGERSPATAEMLARQALAFALAAQRHGREAIDALATASPAKLSPDPFEPELLAVRGTIKGWYGDLEGAIEDLSAVVRWSREGVPLRNLPNAYGALAEAEYRMGRWDEGLTHAEVAISLALDTDRNWELPFVHAVASYFHAGRGNWGLAAEHASSARRFSEAIAVPLSRYYGCVAAANLAFAREDWSEVLEAIAPLHEANARMGLGGLLGRVPWLLEAEAMIRTDRLADAARVLDGMEDKLDDAPGDLARVEMWRLGGVLEHARGSSETARTAFENARAAAQATNSPPAQARLGLSYGHFLHRTGRRRQAIAALRDARELFEQLDARPLIERCDVELAACGVRARSRGSDGDHDLTARELVVARLVASGKTNREAASELYLSTKAIEYHLSNIFTKLDIHSRHELAARLPTPVG